MSHQHRKSRLRQRLVGLAVAAAIAVGILLPAWALMRDGADVDAEGPPAGPRPTSSEPSTSPDPGPTATAAQAGGIRLEADAATARRLEPLALRGTFPGAEPGTLLRLQLLLSPSRWVDLPVPTAVDTAGRFETYVELDRPGTNQVRVRDPRTGHTSNVVSVRVG